MDRVYESGAVAGAPAVPAAPSSGYPTSGDPSSGTPATQPGPYWFYQITEELRNLISNAGLVPDYSNLTQVSAAVQAIIAANTTPAGAELLWPSATPPAGWFEENGALISMTLYEDLYNQIGSDYGLNVGLVTTFDAATDTATAAAHGLVDDDIVELSNSGGALPTGLAAKTKYYIISATANTYQLSDTQGGAAINFTDNGSGTNSTHNQYALPDAQGEFIRIWDHGAGRDPDAATRTDRGDGTTGDNVGTKQNSAFEDHTHGLQGRPGGSAGQYNMQIVNDTNTAIGSADDTLTSRTGAASTETRSRNTNRMMIIKY